MFFHERIFCFQDNYERMKSLVTELEGNVGRALEGGGSKAVARHKSKGKLLARERVSALIDPSSPFLEFSQLAATGLYGTDQVPGAGIVTGIGRISG